MAKELTGNVDGFEAWCDEVDRIAHHERSYTDEKITVVTGREHWRDFFDGGFLPEEALDENESYA